jgi:hypothetical protein
MLALEGQGHDGNVTPQWDFQTFAHKSLEFIYVQNHKQTLNDTAKWGTYQGFPGL